MLRDLSSSTVAVAAMVLESTVRAASMTSKGTFMEVIVALRLRPCSSSGGAPSKLAHWQWPSGYPHVMGVAVRVPYNGARGWVPMVP